MQPKDPAMTTIAIASRTRLDFIVFMVFIIGPFGIPAGRSAEVQEGLQEGATASTRKYRDYLPGALG